jgi:2-polyprenyl-6-methoxyphenol hydroxylase-like FAD-dependent oxidoreductase
VEILDIAPWRADANFAERRLGGNAGVQDAHNLAWKLAAVVKGDAGPGLLDTYEAERDRVRHRRRAVRRRLRALGRRRDARTPGRRGRVALTRPGPA